MQMEAAIGQFRLAICPALFLLLSFFIGSGIDGRIDAVLANRI